MAAALAATAARPPAGEKHGRSRDEACAGSCSPCLGVGSERSHEKGERDDGGEARAQGRDGRMEAERKVFGVARGHPYH